MRHISQAVLVTVLLTLPVVTSAQMVWNKAAYFDGTTYFTIPPAPELDITGSFTIEMMIFLPDSSLYTRNCGLVEKRTGSASEGYDVYLNMGRVNIRTNGTTRLYGASQIPVNRWTHVRAGYNQATLYFTVHINGIWDTSAAKSGASPISSADSVKVGKGFNGYFHGYLENVRVWNKPPGETPVDRYMRSQLATGGGIYDGLVLSLPFQRAYKPAFPFTTTDQSVYHHGSLNHGVVVKDFGYGPYEYQPMNQCLHLYGENGYLSGADAVAISPTAAITMEAWVWPDTQRTHVILAKGKAYRLVIGSGGNLSAVINGNTVISPEIIPLDRWTHVAFTYAASGERYAFYVNGETAGSGMISGAGAIADNTDSLLIGGGILLSDFKGYLDEVRIASYSKTQNDIKAFLYRSIDHSNEPYTVEYNVVYGFDGTTMDNSNDGGPHLVFNGDAEFTSPHVLYAPESPMVRGDEVSFSNGFYIHPLYRSIADGALMKPDSIYISQDLAVTDVNVFVAINHPDERNVWIRLVSPDGVSRLIFSGQQLLGAGGNVVTIFDDQADSVQSGNMSFCPMVRPVNALNPMAPYSSRGWWKITVQDVAADGRTGYAYAWGVQINNQVLVDVSAEPPIPGRIDLAQNYPNPFNPTTVIGYRVPAVSDVNLVVYDLLGREVKTLVNERKMPGSYEVTFDASDLASGVYFYRLTAGNSVQTRKMALVR